MLGIVRVYPEKRGTRSYHNKGGVIMENEKIELTNIESDFQDTGYGILCPNGIEYSSISEYYDAIS